MSPPAGPGRYHHLRRQGVGRAGLRQQHADLAGIGQVDFEVAATFNGGPGKNTARVNFGDLLGTEPSLVNFS